MLIVGVAIAIGVGLFLWARFIRKRPRERGRRDRAPYAIPIDTSPNDLGPGDRPHHRRRRRRRRDHRTRNPTLAETGGLPPHRPPGQLPA